MIEHLKKKLELLKERSQILQEDMIGTYSVSPRKTTIIQLIDKSKAITVEYQSMIDTYPHDLKEQTLFADIYFDMGVHLMDLYHFSNHYVTLPELEHVQKTKTSILHAIDQTEQAVQLYRMIYEKRDSTTGKSRSPESDYTSAFSTLKSYKKEYAVFCSQHQPLPDTAMGIPGTYAIINKRLKDERVRITTNDSEHFESNSVALVAPDHQTVGKKRSSSDALCNLSNSDVVNQNLANFLKRAEKTLLIDTDVFALKGPSLF